MGFSGEGNGPAEAKVRRMDELMRRRQRPGNEVPVTVPLDAVLAADGDSCVYLSGSRVYSTGVELSLTAVTRAAPSGRMGLGTALHGRGVDGGQLFFGSNSPTGAQRTTWTSNPALTPSTTRTLRSCGGERAVTGTSTPATTSPRCHHPDPGLRRGWSAFTPSRDHALGFTRSTLRTRPDD